MTGPARLLILAILAVGATVGIALITHAPDESDRAVAEYTAYRMARLVITHRRHADSLAARALVAARHKSDTAVTSWERIARSVEEGPAVVVDAPLVLVGTSLAPRDTAVTLGLYRALRASGDTVIRQFLAERANTTAALAAKDGVITAQDSALVRADTALAVAHRVLEAQRCRILTLPCPSRPVVAVAALVTGLLIRR